MNHACISVEFSVFFIAKMHDSQSFSLISCKSLILYCSIEYGNVGIKRAAKRQKNRTKAEMTKRRIAEVILVRCGEELRRCVLRRSEDTHCRCELVDQSFKGLGYVVAKQPLPLGSEAPFPKRELAEP